MITLKKFWGVLLVMLTTFSLGACGNSGSTTESTGPNYADAEFLEAFSTGLEKRWSFIDANPDIGEKELSSQAIEIEKENLADFNNRPFEDSKLQEKAISYINQLDEGLELLNTYGADSFYQNWDSYYVKRTQTILDLTDDYAITFSDEHSATIDEMRAHGKEVQDAADNKAILEALFQSVVFEYEPTEYDEDYKNYVAVVENNTGFEISSISASVNIIDSEDVVVDNQYIYAENWKKDQKFRFEFMTDKEVSKQDIQLEYYEIKQ